MKSSLVWPPTGSYLFSAVERNELSIAISPFIKVSALEQLLERCTNTSELQIVTCWNRHSLLSGVTDPEIFPIIEEAGARLYTHPRIHLKLFVLSENRGFHTSSNVTLRGLGLIDNANVEVGCEVQLGPEDWVAIYQILHESTRVDQRMYEQALEYVALHKGDLSEAPPLELSPADDKEFSLDSFPIYPSPFDLVVDCERLNASVAEIDNRFLHALAHDSALFKLDRNMTKETLMLTLRNNFQSSPFVQAIISLLKEEKSARFGLVTNWVQMNCSDKPSPYRSDIKDSVRILYTWLEYFYDEISWSVPGAHSMIIQWREIGD